LPASLACFIGFLATATFFRCRLGHDGTAATPCLQPAAQNRLRLSRANFAWDQRASLSLTHSQLHGY
jgi:hypothetical protein